MPVKILVTGACGLLGHELCEQLTDLGHDVVGLDDLSRGQNRPRCSRLILETLSIATTLDKDFDMIYHFAARNGTSYFYDANNALINNNIEGDLAIFRHALTCDRLQALIYASSSEVVAGSPAPQTESTDLVIKDLHNARWGYRLCKMLSENYLANSNIPWVIVRFFNVYGEHSMSGHFVYDIVQKIKRHQFELIGADELRCYCHVEDAVNAVIGVSQRIGHTVNIGHNEPITARDAANIIAATLGYHQVHWKPLPGRPGSALTRIPDLSVLHRLLPEWRPRDFRTGITSIITGM